MRHGLVFLELGSCPDTELKHRKELGQMTGKKEVAFIEIVMSGVGEIEENSLLGIITGWHVYTNRQRWRRTEDSILDIQCNVSTKD